MGFQRGTGSGLSGLISIPGVSAKFEVRIYRWQMRMNGATKARRGRGGGVYKTARWMMSAGTGACTGKLRLDGWPVPNAWKGQAGTLTVQIHTDKTIAYPVMITEHGPKLDEKTEDLPDFSFAWEITGEPTYTGWGDGTTTQPAATDPSKADQIQWEGSSKTYDPSGLQDGAVVLIDIWGALGDTDSAETAKLIAVVTAAAAPMTNQKKRTATYQRDAIDGGTITVTFGLTDIAEDVINPRTSTTTDPQKIQSGGSVAAINATPSLPAISGQTTVSRGEQTSELNDQKTLHVTQFGQRSTADDLTMPGRWNDIDVSDLQSTGAWVDLFAAGGSAPADPSPTDGLQIVGSRIFDVNRDISQKVYALAKDTPKQKWEQGNSYSVLDANTLESVAHAAAIDDSTPTAPSDGNLVKRTQRVELVTHDHVGYIDEYGLRTTTEDRTFPGTFADVDPLGIETTGRTTEVYTTAGGVPADPSVVSGTQIVGQRTERVNRIKSQRVTAFDVLNSEQKRTFPKIRTTDDANNLEDDAIRVEFWTVGDAPPALPSDAPGNNVKLIDFVDLPETPTRNMRVWAYGPANSRDKLVLPHVRTDADASAIKSEAVRAALDGESITDPGAPYVLRNTYTKTVTVGLATNRVLTVKTYGLLTTAQELEYGSSEASWSWRDENRLTIAEVVTDGGTLASVRNALVASYGNTVTSEEIRVHPTVPGKFLVMITTVTEEVVVDFDMRGAGERYVAARFDGTDVYVFARSVRKLGTSLYERDIGPTRYGGTQNFFTITRRVVGGTLPIHAALTGTTNDGPFLGLALGTVQYMGTGGTAKIDSSGDGVGVSVISYKFFYDSLGQFDLGNCSEGLSKTTTNLTSYLDMEAHWRKATDLGFNSASLSQEDYSVFIT